jgi:hypothetical protein
VRPLRNEFAVWYIRKRELGSPIEPIPLNSQNLIDEISRVLHDTIIDKYGE